MDRPLTEVLSRKGSDVYTIGSDDTAYDAVRSMNRHHIGSLVVVHADRMLGIFTERDVLQRVIAAGHDPTRVAVKEVMTHRVVSVSPDTSVQHAMRVMTRTRHRHLPVVEAGKIVGLVSIGDLTAWVTRDLQTQLLDLTGYVFGEAAAAAATRVHGWAV